MKLNFMISYRNGYIAITQTAISFVSAIDLFIIILCDVSKYLSHLVYFDFFLRVPKICKLAL